jgi:UDP-GlcNAc:undecaprenyl-phosphate GlcNAc-1-phosphate transferase
VRLEELPFILAALLAAAGAAWLLTPAAMRLARRSGAIDEPDAGRRVHSRPIPRAGGLAVVAAFVGVSAIAILLIGVSKPSGPFPFRYVWSGNEITRDQLVALLGGALLAAAFGFIDDRWQIRARWQLVFQVALAVMAIALGVTISVINNPLDFLGGIFAPPTIRLMAEAGPLTPAAILVTILWVVGMINSINFIDGLDGLSTGIALIAALILGMISLTEGVG